jgi:undecaprenyl-diphosphatase
VTWLEVIVLGLVQGLTEFLPISSSAHLRITSEVFFGRDAGAAFTAVTQLGTEAAGCRWCGSPTTTRSPGW